MSEITYQERREASHVIGEMAASRLHDVIRDRLETISERDGLTQSELAKRLGIPEQQLSHWLTAPRNMTVKSAGRLMAALEAYLTFDIEPFESIGKIGNAPASTATVYLVETDANRQKFQKALPNVNVGRASENFTFAPQNVKIFHGR